MVEDTTLNSPRLRAALDEIPALVMVLRGPELRVALANPRRRGLAQATEIEGMTAAEMLDHSLAGSADRDTYLAALRRVMETGETVRSRDAEVVLAGDDSRSQWDVVLLPLRAAPGAPPDGVVVHATEVTRRVTAETRWNALFEAHVIGIVIADETTILECNDAYLAMVGLTREQFGQGIDYGAITVPEYHAADERALAILERGGEVAPYEKAYVRPDGEIVHVLVGASLLNREPLRILGIFHELTARKAAEAEASALLARTRRLQEVTATLSASNTTAAIARAVVHHSLEELGASAGILVGDQEIEHAVGLDREAIEQWRAFPATMPQLLRHPTGRLEHAPDLLPGGAALAVPVTGGEGEALGTLALAFRDRRRLAPADSEFVRALAWQAGLALDRARLYEDRAYVARKLQEGLLPDRLPAVAGLEAAVVYESISGGGEVGGDFYDLFEAGPDRWFAAVGDVCGKGTDAAVITGLARHTVRAIAYTGEAPAAVLAFLNGALRRHAALPSFCTVGCAVLEPDPAGGFAVRLSSGGHPFPLVLRADGALEEVEVTGTMLGVSEFPELVEVTVRLAPGDALILYTDGVTDARRLGGERFGEERMLAALRSAAGRDADGIAATVETAVRAHLPGASADDRAIVVLRAAL